MPIDWFTVAAQAINFLVLVALLKRFLYGPIVRTMTERQQRIASRLADADVARRRAEQQVEEMAGAKRELESRRESMLDEASEQARARGRALLEQAREDVACKESEWLTELERKRAQLVELVTERTNDNLVVALRQTLADLADEDLQDRAVRVFLGRLDHLEPQEKSDLEAVLGEPEITVSTAFPVSPDQERTLRAALAEMSGNFATLRFDTDRALVCGLQLSAAGRRVAWSFRQAVRDTEAVLGASLGPTGEASLGV